MGGIGGTATKLTLNTATADGSIKVAAGAGGNGGNGGAGAGGAISTHNPDGGLVIDGDILFDAGAAGVATSTGVSAPGGKLSGITATLVSGNVTSSASPATAATPPPPRAPVVPYSVRKSRSGAAAEITNLLPRRHGRTLHSGCRRSGRRCQQ